MRKLSKQDNERFKEWFDRRETQEYLDTLIEKIAESMMDGTASVLDHNKIIYNTGMLEGIQQAIDTANELANVNSKSGDGIFEKLKQLIISKRSER